MEGEVPGNEMGAVLIEMMFVTLICFFRLKGEKTYTLKKCQETIT